MSCDSSNRIVISSTDTTYWVRSRIEHAIGELWNGTTVWKLREKLREVASMEPWTTELAMLAIQRSTSQFRAQHAKVGPSGRPDSGETSGRRGWDSSWLGVAPIERRGLGNLDTHVSVGSRRRDCPILARKPATKIVDLASSIPSDSTQIALTEATATPMVTSIQQRSLDKPTGTVRSKLNQDGGSFSSWLFNQSKILDR